MSYAINQNKVLTPAELEHLLNSIRATDNLRDQAVLLTLVNTGARATEVLNIERQDVLIPSRSVIIKGLKGSNDREIPLRATVFKILEAQLPDQGKVFPISYQRLYQIWNWYRPCEKTIHALRHTFAINLYLKTKDMHLVKLALGHKSLMNTQVYVDFCYSQNQMKRLIL